VESVATKVSGQTAQKFVFKAVGPISMVIVVYAFIYRDVAYTLTYMGMADRYQKDKAMIAKISASLKTYF
jgi:hypothetical protein